MISVQLLQGQGLGNQLWNIVSGFGVANKLGLKFSIRSYDNFKGTDFIDFSHFDHDKLYPSDCLKVDIVDEESFFDQELNYLLSCYDSSLYSRIRPTDSNIILRGLLQAEEYFSGIDIYSLFRYADHFHDYDIEMVKSHSCILNIRGGEYKKYSNFILPKSYWLNAIKYMKSTYGVQDFIVVTDDDIYARTLFPNLPVISNSVFNCYLALYKAKYVVSSNSTFSYFPIATSMHRKKLIIGPKYWANFNNPDSGRWLSPCSTYRGWHWMDASGKVFSTKTCLPLAKETEHFYRRNYNVRISDYSSLYKRKYPFSTFLSPSLKKLLIKSLRPFFPTAI